MEHNIDNNNDQQQSFDLGTIGLTPIQSITSQTHTPDGRRSLEREISWGSLDRQVAQNLHQTQIQRQEEHSSTRTVNQTPQNLRDPNVVGLPRIAEKYKKLLTRTPERINNASFLQPLLQIFLEDCFGVSEMEFWMEKIKSLQIPLTVPKMPKGFCAKVPGPKEIVYKCEDCSADPNALICAECFEGSSHYGHDFRILKGIKTLRICGCGDPSAIKVGYAPKKFRNQVIEGNEVEERFEAFQLERAIGTAVFYLVEALEALDLTENDPTWRLMLSQIFLDFLCTLLKIIDLRSEFIILIARIFSKKLRNLFKPGFRGGVKLSHNCSKFDPKSFNYTRTQYDNDRPQRGTTEADFVKRDCQCTVLQLLLRTHSKLLENDSMPAQTTLARLLYKLSSSKPFKETLVEDFLRYVNFGINWSFLYREKVKMEELLTPLFGLAPFILNNEKINTLVVSRHLGTDNGILSHIFSTLEHIVYNATKTRYPTPQNQILELILPQTATNLIFTILKLIFGKRETLIQLLTSETATVQLLNIFERVYKLRLRLKYLSRVEPGMEIDVDFGKGLKSCLELEARFVDFFGDCFACLFSGFPTDVNDCFILFMRSLVGRIREVQNEFLDQESSGNKKRGFLARFNYPFVLLFERVFVMGLVVYSSISAFGSGCIDVVEPNPDTLKWVLIEIFKGHPSKMKQFLENRILTVLARSSGFLREVSNGLWSVYGPNLEILKKSYYQSTLNHKIDTAGLQISAILLPTAKFLQAFKNGFCDNSNPLYYLNAHHPEAHILLKPKPAPLDTQWPVTVHHKNQSKETTLSYLDLFSTLTRVLTSNLEHLYITDLIVNRMKLRKDCLEFGTLIYENAKNVKEEIVDNLILALPNMLKRDLAELVARQCCDFELVSKIFKKKCRVSRNFIQLKKSVIDEAGKEYRSGLSLVDSSKEALIAQNPRECLRKAIHCFDPNLLKFDSELFNGKVVPTLMSRFSQGNERGLDFVRIPEFDTQMTIGLYFKFCESEAFEELLEASLGDLKLVHSAGEAIGELFRPLFMYFDFLVYRSSNRKIFKNLVKLSEQGLQAIDSKPLKSTLLNKIKIFKTIFTERQKYSSKLSETIIHSEALLETPSSLPHSLIISAAAKLSEEILEKKVEKKKRKKFKKKRKKRAKKMAKMAEKFLKNAGIEITKGAKLKVDGGNGGQIGGGMEPEEDIICVECTNKIDRKKPYLQLFRIHHSCLYEEALSSSITRLIHSDTETLGEEGFAELFGLRNELKSLKNTARHLFFTSCKHSVHLECGPRLKGNYGLREGEGMRMDERVCTYCKQMSNFRFLVLPGYEIEWEGDLWTDVAEFAEEQPRFALGSVSEGLKSEFKVEKKSAKSGKVDGVEAKEGLPGYGLEAKSKLVEASDSSLVENTIKPDSVTSRSFKGPADFRKSRGMGVYTTESSRGAGETKSGEISEIADINPYDPKSFQAALGGFKEVLDELYAKDSASVLTFHPDDHEKFKKIKKLKSTLEAAKFHDNSVKNRFPQYIKFLDGILPHRDPLSFPSKDIILDCQILQNLKYFLLTSPIFAIDKLIDVHVPTYNQLYHQIRLEMIPIEVKNSYSEMYQKRRKYLPGIRKMLKGVFLRQLEFIFGILGEKDDKILGVDSEQFVIDFFLFMTQTCIDDVILVKFVKEVIRIGFILKMCQIQVLRNLEKTQPKEDDSLGPMGRKSVDEMLYLFLVRCFALKMMVDPKSAKKENSVNLAKLTGTRLPRNKNLQGEVKEKRSRWLQGFLGLGHLKNPKNQDLSKFAKRQIKCIKKRLFQADEDKENIFGLKNSQIVEITDYMKKPESGTSEGQKARLPISMQAYSLDHTKFQEFLDDLDKFSNKKDLKSLKSKYPKIFPKSFKKSISKAKNNTGGHENAEFEYDHSQQWQKLAEVEKIENFVSEIEEVEKDISEMSKLLAAFKKPEFWAKNFDENGKFKTPELCQIEGQGAIKATASSLIVKHGLDLTSFRFPFVFRSFKEAFQNLCIETCYLCEERQRGADMVSCLLCGATIHLKNCPHEGNGHKPEKRKGNKIFNLAKHSLDEHGGKAVFFNAVTGKYIITDLTKSYCFEGLYTNVFGSGVHDNQILTGEGVAELEVDSEVLAGLEDAFMAHGFGERIRQARLKDKRDGKDFDMFL